MKIEIKKVGKEYRVYFGFGVQSFELSFTANKKDAEWMAKMLKRCFLNYKKSILQNDKSRV